MIFAIFVCSIFLTTARGQEIQNITQDTGTIASANYPSGVYHAGTRGRYYVQTPGPSAGKKMVIKFNRYFDVEGYYEQLKDCRFDRVAIYDGRFERLLRGVCDKENMNVENRGIFCNGATLPPLVGVDNQKFIVEFCSDAVVQGHGFSFSFETMDNWPTVPPPPTPTPTGPPIPYECGGTIELNATHLTQQLRSPGYPPGPYPNNARCEWKVVAPEQYHISVVTEFFDVESYNEDCEFDYLLGIDEVTGEEQRYCQEGPFYFGAPNVIKFSFHSDEQIQRVGFSLRLIALPPATTAQPYPDPCDKNYTLSSPDDKVQIYSPGFPNPYPNNAHCDYNMYNELWHQNLSMQIRVIHFSTQRNYDFLYVQAIGEETEPTRYTGRIPADAKRRYDTRVVLARFTSDPQITAAGFQAEITLVPRPFTCPGPDMFKCTTLNQCIPKVQRCDHVAHCPDESDEDPKLCTMPDICGRQVIKPNIFVPGEPGPRIVNGTEAKPGSWPWMVSLHENGGQFCGGSLVSPRWVITAGHCFYGNDQNPEIFTVKVGSHHLDTFDAPWQFDARVRGVYVHPKFTSSPSTSYDITLLRLEDEVPFQFNNHTGVPCLPEGHGHDIVADGVYCVTTGWGTTHGTGDNTVLRQVAVPVVENKRCNDSDHYNGDITDTQMCAGFEQGGKDSCQGDSGGPLVCRDSQGRWVLQGIVSWGEGCARPRRPGVYSRLSTLMDFVEEIVDKYD